MATMTRLTGRDLFRALEAQGFEVIDKGERLTIVPPNEEAPLHFHTSTFTRAADESKRGYENALGRLKRAGFDPDKPNEEPNPNGEAWKEERDAIEAEIAEANAEAATEQMEAAAKSAVELDRMRKINALPTKARELYERIASKPGLHPKDYAEDTTHAAAQRASQAANRYLLSDGLIEGTGDRKSRRWWLAGEVGQAPLSAMAANGRPTAGPVRIRQQTPGDPLIVYRRLVARLSDKATETAAIVAELVAVHEQTHAELVELRAKVRRVESVLGRAIDAL